MGTRDAFLAFDGMTWPNPDDPCEVEWTLRYGAPTRDQLMVAASIIAAYKQLVDDPVRRRNEKVTGIRASRLEARRRKEVADRRASLFRERA